MRLRGRSLIQVGENCNSPESQVLLKLCFWGDLRGDSASWSLDSPSRIADLVAGPRLDSTSPDMDSASRRCSAETLTVQFGSYLTPLRPSFSVFWSIERNPNRCGRLEQGRKLWNLEELVRQEEEGFG